MQVWYKVVSAKVTWNWQLLTQHFPCGTYKPCLCGFEDLFWWNSDNQMVRDHACCHLPRSKAMQCDWAASEPPGSSVLGRQSNRWSSWHHHHILERALEQHIHTQRDTHTYTHTQNKHIPARHDINTLQGRCWVTGSGCYGSMTRLHTVMDECMNWRNIKQMTAQWINKLITHTVLYTSRLEAFWV